MKKDAEAQAEEDKKKAEAIEVKNNADTWVHTTQKALDEAGDKISVDKKKPVEEKLEALKKIKDGDDTEAIKKASEELSTEAQKIGQEMYQAAQQAQQAAGGAPGPDGSAQGGQADQQGAEGKPGDEPEVKDAEEVKEDPASNGARKKQIYDSSGAQRPALLEN